jgi:transposase
MRTYSMDLRERVLAACDDGLGTAEVAETFAVSESWVRRLKQRRRETGSAAPRVPARHGPVPVLTPQAERLRAAVQDHPGQTAADYRDLLGLDVVPLTVWRMLRRLGLTFKKRRSAPANRTAPTSRPPARRGGRT